MYTDAIISEKKEIVNRICREPAGCGRDGKKTEYGKIDTFSEKGT